MPWPNIPPVSRIQPSCRSDFAFSFGWTWAARRNSDFGTGSGRAMPGCVVGSGRAGSSARGAIRRAPLCAETSGYEPAAGAVVAIMWAVSALSSDMWSRSMTIPNRIASRTATSPAIVSPAAFRSPFGVHGPVMGAAEGNPICWAMESRCAQTVDFTVTFDEIWSSVARPLKPSVVDGIRPVRNHELIMNMKS